MSLGIIIKSPEGLVLAAESRVTLTSTINSPTGSQIIFNNFDNASKVLKFNAPNNYIGIVTYGQAAIGLNRTAQSFIPEFESKLNTTHPNERLTVLSFAQELSAFFLEKWNTLMPANFIGLNMVFNVAGYDVDEAYGKVFAFEIPRLPIPVEQSAPINNVPQFGLTWGGQREIVDRMIYGYDSRIIEILQQAGIEQQKIVEIQNRLKILNLQMPVQFMPLQDCINLAHLFISTTIDTQELTVGLRGCGGAIDIARITKNEPFEFIQEKHLTINKNR